MTVRVPVALPYVVVPAALAGLPDVSVQVQAIHDRLYTAFGCGELRFPQGTYNVNLVVNEKMAIAGAGIGATILKSVAGSNGDVIKGKDFATLTGKAKATGDITRGAYRVAVRDLTIDGNKANNVGGYGIRIWGCALRFTNIIVQNCDDDGIYTEFTTHDAGANADMLEGYFSDINSNNNGGNGWTFRGPHDSYLQNYVAVSNAGWAFKNESSSGSYNGTVGGGTRWNSWLNTTGSFQFNSSINSLSDVIASGGFVGTGIEFGASTGSAKMTNIEISGHEFGLIARGSDCQFSGKIQLARNVANNAGVAITLDGATRWQIDAIGSSNYEVLDPIQAGVNRLSLLFDVASGRTFFSDALALTRANAIGLPFGTLTEYSLTQTGGAGNARVGREPIGDRSFLGTLHLSGVGGSLSTDPSFGQCTGSPEGSITAPPGSMRWGTDGKTYSKATGTGNTGWVRLVTEAIP